MARTASIVRKTRETDINLSVNLDGDGKGVRESGIGFLDHMLDLLAKHALLDLDLKAIGDHHVDDHHTCEDIGIALGEVVDRALGDRAGIRRYGHFTLPMDEALVTAAIDFGGRYAFDYQAPIAAAKVGTFDSELVEHFWQSFTANAKCNLHVILHHGRNSHHIAECVFKATAHAIRMAVESDPRCDAVPSTKGVL
jgi:imidazoleglycerol-phosphate dehydratase